MVDESLDATWSSIGTGSYIGTCAKADQVLSETLVLALAPSQAPVLSLA